MGYLRRGVHGDYVAELATERPVALADAVELHCAVVVGEHGLEVSGDGLAAIHAIAMADIRETRKQLVYGRQHIRAGSAALGRLRGLARNTVDFPTGLFV